MAHPSGWSESIKLQRILGCKIHLPYHQSASYTRRHSSSNAGDLEYLASVYFALPENFKDAHILNIVNIFIALFSPDNRGCPDCRRESRRQDYEIFDSIEALATSDLGRDSCAFQVAVGSGCCSLER